MKTFTKKSMALLLAVLMLLSSVVTGTFAFTASAEEAANEEVAYEAALFDEDGVTPYTGTSSTPLAKNTGSFLEMVAAANTYPDAKLVLKLYKDIDLTEPVRLQSKRVGTIDGQGHTIYATEAMLTAARVATDNKSYMFDIWNWSGSPTTFTFTFKNLNINGQPQGWDGTDATAIHMGDSASNKHGGAIIISKYAKLTLDNCRMENFYTYTKASCISLDATNTPEDRTETLGKRGIWLINTTLTNNHHLGGLDAGTNATAIRGRSDQVGTEIHVSGNTYVDNNYTNGLPTANIFTNGGNRNPYFTTKTATDAETGETTYTLSKSFWDNQDGAITVYVEEDFTGSVAITSTGNITTTAYTQPTNIVFDEETKQYVARNAERVNYGTEQKPVYKWEGTDIKTLNQRGTVVFNGTYNPADGGFIYAWRGAGQDLDSGADGTWKGKLYSLVVPDAEPTTPGEAKLIKAAYSNAFYYIGADGEWINAPIGSDSSRADAFTALNNTKSTETLTEAQRLEAASKNLLVLTGDLAKHYFGSAISGMYTVYGNGHVMTARWSGTWGGLPMIRYSDSNATVLFNDIIFDGDMKAADTDSDGYLEFDKISTTAVETDELGPGGWFGGALGSYAAGTYMVLDNVEIRNFVQNRCNAATTSDQRSGSAIHDNYGGTWMLNDVYIHDNLTGKNGAAVHLVSGNSRLTVSGELKMENNYASEYEKDGSAIASSHPAGSAAAVIEEYLKQRKTAVTDNIKLIGEVDIHVTNANNLRIDSTAQSDSLIVKGLVSEGKQFANLAVGAELDVVFSNFTNTSYVPYVESEAVNGYYPVVWADPNNLPEEVSFTVMGTDGTTVVLNDWTQVLKGGDALPTLTGLTWYNDETAATEHTKGVASYVGKWAMDATAAVLVSYDNRESWAVSSKLEALHYTSSLPTDMELLEGYTFTSGQKINKFSSVTVDGNGFTSTVAKDYSGTYIFNMDQNNNNSTTTKTFKNFNFDGSGWINPATETGIFQIERDSGTWVFDNCKFSNCVSTGQTGVFRPVGRLTLVLKDVTMTNCGGTQGAVRVAYNNATLAPVLKLEGNTIIKGTTTIGSGETQTTLKNCIYFNTYGAIAVTGDFDGEVDIDGNALGTDWATVDRVLASSEFVAEATVAEGAEITGKIWNMDSTKVEGGYELFAYDNNGVLCWGDETSAAKFACTFDVNGGVQVIENGKYLAGEELPAPRKADLTGETPVFYAAKWYYDNAGVKTETDVIVSGVTAYYVGEYIVDDTVEAYVSESNYGSLADVYAAAVNGDRIELVKSIALEEQFAIYKSLTIDGNGKSLSFALAQDGTAILRDNLIYIGQNLRVTFTGVVFDGGASAIGNAAGVWTQQIQAPGKGFINTGNGTNDYSITYNDCTFKGIRVLSTSESFSVIHVNSGYKIYFTGNTDITDNLVHAVKYVNNVAQAGELATDKNSTNASGSVASIPSGRAGAVIRCDGNSKVYIQGNPQMSGNFMVYQVEGKGEGGAVTYTPAYHSHGEFTSGGSNAKPGFKRVVIGPLDTTANVYANFANGYMVALDEQGNPYPIGDQIKNAAGTKSYNYMVSAYCANNPNNGDAAADLAFHTSNGGDELLPVFRTDGGMSIVKGDGGPQVKGNLASDKLTLNVYLTIKAHPTEILKVYIGDALVVKQTVGEYGTLISRNLTAGDTYGQLKITVPVGMAQLTDNIKFALCEADGTEVSTFTTTAKSYIDNLLAAGTLTTSAVSVEALKNALAALLQYGAMAQIQFDHNTENLANAGDLSAYDFYRVDANVLSFSDASQVKAVKSGSLNGVTIVGSTLLLQNQISMRIYVTVDDASLYTFTVDDEPCELQTAKNGNTYIEIKNIGTADLAKFVTLAITPVAGGEGVTYTVSPMSYVYSVNGSTSANVTESLKNVCEAMFYYFDAVMTAYGKTHGITFLTEEVLAPAIDVANNYSTPYGITV